MTEKTGAFANLWTHRAYSPFIMRLCLEATTGGLARVFPESKIASGGSYWRGGQENYFYVESEVGATVNAIARKTLENSEFIYGFLKPALEKAAALNDFAEKFAVNHQNLSDAAFEELAEYVNEFGNRYREMYAYGTVPTLLGYREENALYAKMNEILTEKTANSPGKFAKSLLVLTRPLKKLKIQEQERGILWLAEKAKRGGLKTSGEVLARYSKELNALFEQFAWISFDLCDSIAWNRSHFAGLVAEKMLLTPAKIGEEIAFNEDYEKRAANEFEEASKALGLTESERRVFEVVRDVGFYKWAREYEFLHAFYLAKFVQDELGRRCGLSTLESKYVLHDEWRAAEKNPEEFKRKTRSRIENCLILGRDGATAVFEGEAAHAEYKKLRFVKEEVEKEAAQLRGTPACAGSARGRVNVINAANEIGKMREGDVLVSVTTNPDLVPAMKRAAAIVTSEGGITCHAAIVSRELGIPCVVGVRNAHKILRDGDVVEVDAMHGVVKKVS